MTGKANFKYICAHRSKSAHYLFRVDAEYEDYDCHSSCIIWDTITLYGVPHDLSDEALSNVFDGKYADAIEIGSMYGCLILCKQMLTEGEDPWLICDDEDGDLEYTISALKDPECPLNEDDGNPWQDVYYIHEWNMKRGYKSAALKSEILDRLPNIILMLFNVKPDILVYYPAPLKYKPDPNEEARHKALQNIGMQKLEAAFSFLTDKSNNSESGELKNNIRNFGVYYKLNENEFNYLARRRQVGISYPESAKRKSEFSFFESNGFVEAGNSRLLYKISDQ